MQYNIWYDRPGINNLTRCNNIHESTTASFISYKCSLISSLKYLNIKNYKINDLTKTCYKNIYPIKLGYYKNDASINIDDICLFYKLFKDCNSEILLFYPHEIFIIDHNILSFLERLHDQFKELKIRVLSADLKDIDQLPDYVSHTRFDYFRFSTAFFNFTKIRPEITQSAITKDFIFLNGRYRTTRALMYFDLLSKQHLKNAIHSFHGYTGELIPFDEIIDTYYTEFTTADCEYIKNNFDLVSTKAWLSEIYKSRKPESFSEEIYNISQNELINMYNQSALEIINESFFDSNNTLFLTEKTYRPIAYGKMFLLCGQRHSLEYLKSQGFETFNELFDESYDDEILWTSRWNIIKNNINLWINMSHCDKKHYYQKNYDKIVHNQELLYTNQNIRNILE